MSAEKGRNIMAVRGEFFTDVGFPGMPKKEEEKLSYSEQKAELENLLLSLREKLAQSNVFLLLVEKNSWKEESVKAASEEAYMFAETIKEVERDLRRLTSTVSILDLPIPFAPVGDAKDDLCAEEIVTSHPLIHLDHNDK